MSHVIDFNIIAGILNTKGLDSFEQQNPSHRPKGQRATNQSVAQVIIFTEF